MKTHWFPLDCHEKQKDIDGGDPDSGYLSVSKGTKLLVTVPRLKTTGVFCRGFVGRWECSNVVRGATERVGAPPPPPKAVCFGCIFLGGGLSWELRNDLLAEQKITLR